ncbi:MAG: hypothetical protein ACREFE_14675, partial [Limisphaerales bacterium]
YFSLQNCDVYGGRINVGNPDSYDSSLDQIYGPGAVYWFNNLFDGVSINLDPTYYEYGDDDQGLNVDMQIQAYNNLFRGGLWFRLEPVPASAGNWIFKDNLFDKVDIWQDVNGNGSGLAQPLDYDYNAYWPLTTSELAGNGDGDAAELQPTDTSNDGFTDGTAGNHEVILSSSPAFNTGPFGDFYVPWINTTPLYNAGSRSAADAGLAQYTMDYFQAKDSGQVDIGRHYVATTRYNVATPLDTDGDGVPDYVEDANGDGVAEANETDWTKTKTDGSTPDAYSTVYDDIDLDSDGLTGRAERILGTNPLTPDNPLTLTPVITGEEPYILTYSMPLSVDVSSNGCDLLLLDNGTLAGGYDFEQQTNGTYLVTWNNTFTSYGFHALQVKLSMPGATIPSNDTDDKQTVNLVLGTTRIENVTNLVQFDPDTSLFSSQAWIYGTLQVQSADYEIDIYDTNDDLLTTITNHTDNGVIDEVWNLTATNGEVRDDPEFNAQIYITPNDENGPPGLVSGPYPYHLLRTLNYGGDTFTMAFGWNTSYYFTDRQQMIQNNVVDVLFNPGADDTYNNTFLNTFDGTCFNLGSTNDEPVLLDDLSNGSVKNVYWDGHGADNNFGSATGDADHAAGLGRIGTGDLKIALLNIINAVGTGWTKRDHRYRLVILNSCDSAEDSELANAFGEYGRTYNTAWFDRKGEPPQAFVGWVGDDIGPVYPFSFDSYGAHLNVLFELWMENVPLEDCLIEAGTPDPDFSFDMPLDSRWKIFGDPQLTRTPQ